MPLIEASLSTRISEGTEPDVGGASSLALRYAACALAATLLAVPAAGASPVLAALLLWLAVANAVVAFGYHTGRVAVFGKRHDGRLALLPTLLLLPYLVLVWGFFWAKTLGPRRSEACWHRAAPGLYVGRRPRAGELPDDCNVIVDLTCEFTETQDVVRKHSYRCLPILNRHVPRESELRALLQALHAHDGGIYVHCGAGRGRSAMVVAALLVLRGHAADVERAEHALVALRPGVKLHAAQRALIARCCGSLRSGAAPQTRPASAATTSAS
jgi:protein-tyrosine phosphatase